MKTIYCIIMIGAGATIKGQRSMVTRIGWEHDLIRNRQIIFDGKGYRAMSQAETEAYRTTELRDMAGEGDKKPGCCTRCPCLCGGVLLVTAFVSLAAAAVIGGFYPELHHLVDGVIEEVRSEMCVDPVIT